MTSIRTFLATSSVLATLALGRQPELIDPINSSVRRPAVVVCVGPTSGIPIYSATQLASQIFGSIDIQIEWHRLRSCPSSPHTIKINFPEVPPAALDASAMAFALPIEGSHIAVFSDRVKAGITPDRVGRLLAYVLVHEITHMLQGVCRHSPGGIMKAHWTDGDLFDVQSMKLGFAQVDIDLIGFGITWRQARFARSELAAVR
jgi:hypothetical protein